MINITFKGSSSSQDDVCSLHRSIIDVQISHLTEVEVHEMMCAHFIV